MEHRDVGADLAGLTWYYLLLTTGQTYHLQVHRTDLHPRRINWIY